MKYLIILSFIFIDISCSTTQSMQRVKFDYSSNGHKKAIEMNIPKSAKFSEITAGGEGKEYQYHYPDSSIIYITDITGKGTINEPLINKDKSDYNKRFSSDTASFEGMMNNKNYWKEVKYFGLFYGYSNTPPNKKQMYDSILTSIKYK